MNMTLQRATIDDAELLWKMQIEAFAELLTKYQDMDTNPGNEKIDKIIKRLEKKDSYYYIIKSDMNNVGAIRVDMNNVGAIRVDMQKNGEKRISPLFILKEYRNQGIAQFAIQEVERIHGSDFWALETILQEKGNCHLYEKMGYKDTGKREEINDK